jgi:phosphonate transport system substrate-binding protein
MVRLGGSATASHLAAFQGLEKHFKKQGIDIDWVLYSDYDAVVEAFVSGEIDLAWNGPLGYVKIKRLLKDSCRVIAMRDVDINQATLFITQPSSAITTVEDLMGKRFAFGSRGSDVAGLLPYHFLKQSGINPRRDLAACSFYEERQPNSRSDQRDVVERVQCGEYDAGAVGRRTLQALTQRGAVAGDSVRVFWTSPGYSHCCFTAQGDMEPEVYRKIAEAFISVDGNDPAGKAVLDAEGCSALVPGISQGWEILEKAAVEEGLV